jgi:hypothetical protein
LAASQVPHGMGPPKRKGRRTGGLVAGQYIYDLLPGCADVLIEVMISSRSPHLTDFLVSRSTSLLFP